MKKFLLVTVASNLNVYKFLFNFNTQCTKTRTKCLEPEDLQRY